MGFLPQNQSQQKKLLAGLVPMLALFAYYQFVHTKRSTEIETLQTQLEMLEATNAAAKVIAAQGGPDLRKRLEVLETHMIRLEELIPDREEVADLLHSMTQRAQVTGVDLTRMKPQAEEEGPYYTKQTYEIGIKGTYHRVGQYLAEVGSLPRIITPIDLKLQSNTNEVDRSGSPLLSATFNIVTYIVPEPVVAPAEKTVDANGQS